MIARKIQASIEDSLKEFPVVGLIGPRQAGKTTLARMILERMGTGPLYLDLELSSDVNKLRDPELYLRAYEDRLVIIDEVQRMPELFPLISDGRSKEKRRPVPYPSVPHHRPS
jgi:predicted AAA+ superfamily ATPase